MEPPTQAEMVALDALLVETTERAMKVINELREMCTTPMEAGYVLCAALTAIIQTQLHKQPEKAALMCRASLDELTTAFARSVAQRRQEERFN